MTHLLQSLADASPPLPHSPMIQTSRAVAGVSCFMSMGLIAALLYCAVDGTPPCPQVRSLTSVLYPDCSVMLTAF
jgi:hypothetical protein